jgi:quinol monooxygenase YgiN
VAIKVIVELQAKPGRRAELSRLLENVVESQGPSQQGFLGSTRYEVLDNPDMLLEIADWESAEARVAHMEESAASGAYAPLIELLAVPFRATVIRQLPSNPPGAPPYDSPTRVNVTCVTPLGEEMASTS